MTVSATHRRLLAAVAALALAAIAGMLALWPTPTPPFDDVPPAATGTVVSHDAPRTPAVVELASGEVVEQVEVASDTHHRAGDPVLLRELDGQWVLIDHDRRQPLLWLTALFAAAVLAVGRWYGLRSLAGLVFSFVVVFVYLIPSILDGNPPALVALTGAVVIMVATLYLAHGITLKTSAAVVGTSAALVATVLLGYLATQFASLEGETAPELVGLRFALPGLDLSGFILAGLIVATLGVLDDVTVSQSSTVFALADANPDLTRRQLFARAMTVGRDHIASVVNTLFLAYAGASLTLLVLLTLSGRETSWALNDEVIATEIVKTLVGSVGLVAAVPLTTALAAAAVTADSRAPR